ncbi:MAG: hypothetical protein KatS3mg102_0167 [Planctomycetota bacterium]|nr:MAG: hypothetical protein KatS3mg102_0167 [Planctomycetota bacterium]
MSFGNAPALPHASRAHTAGSGGVGEPAAGPGAPQPVQLFARWRTEVPIAFNTTAMTDVIFILLIFFVSVSQIRTSSIELQLPAVSTAEQQPAPPGPHLLVVDIDRAGEVYADGEPVPAAGVAEMARRRGAGVRVRIRADEQARSGVLMEVVAGLATAGIADIEFAVQARGGV